MRLKAKGDGGSGLWGDIDRTEMICSSAIRVSLFSVKSVTNLATGLLDWRLKLPRSSSQALGTTCLTGCYDAAYRRAHRAMTRNKCRRGELRRK